ncbi:hypothetical protein MKW92_002403 [Papaver armeniacum]|nr:hypothetical protein MKW92_002403 [Papaver armeniacum]
MRWVWDANRNDPVRENATLTFGRDGNLVLADVDGRVVWQTNTANKGVIDISMQPNGNLVLLDKNGKFVWQSFDYPVDTLLVGQSLKLNGGRKQLISRTSDKDGDDGPYRIVIDKKGFSMYLKTTSGESLQYGGWQGSGLLNVSFDAVPEDQSIFAYELTLAFGVQQQPNTPSTRHLLQSRPVDNSRGIILKKVNYNATISFFRLESDGNIRVFTYFRNTSYLKWDQTYDLLMASPIPIHFYLVFAILLCCFTVLIQSQVTKEKTFQFINQGEFAGYIVDYDMPTDFLSAPSPDAYILAIRAGFPNEEDLMRWVWDANRNDPVRENATLTFGRDGNLVLADVDGRVVWQTNTANKGVIDISMQPNGNLVLLDKNGKFVWQSFDYPVDTLLVGQSLKLNGGRKQLISRTSDKDGDDGPYRIVIDKKGFSMYLKTTSGESLQYGGWQGSGLLNVSFDAVPEDQSIFAYELTLAFWCTTTTKHPSTRHLLQSRPVDNSRGIILKKVNYNATISFFRLESDGNIRVFTYFRNTSYLKWDQTYEFFGDDVRECGLPSKCGSFGFCDRRMCIACPSPKGLLGWSESCKPPPVPSCKNGSIPLRIITRSPV